VPAFLSAPANVSPTYRERLDRSATQHNGHLETLEEKARDILSTLMENRNEANMDISVLTTRLSRLIMAENEKTRELLNATLLQVSRATALEASRSSSLDVGSQLHDDSWVSISRANTPSPAPALSLHEAVRSGTLQQVRKILRSVRQNVDELDEEGCSALHTACVNKRFDIAKYLIQKGADVNQDDDTGSTPLHYAVQSGDAAFVRFLLSRHANRDFENDEGRKPFYYTDKNNWLLEWLRKWGHHVDAVDTVTGFTALIQAVRTGDEASVRELIDQGADLDAQCRTNNTALHYACESDNTSITSLLIDNRCKLDLKNKADWTPLMAAVRHGNLSAVQLLVSAGADLEATSSDEDYEKFTPLIAAIHEKHAPIACHLISAGAVLHTRDHSGYTPINRAGQAGLLDIVRLLVERGQSINEQNCNSGWSVIAEAAFHDFPDIVDYLADLGANLETRDGNRDTPLQKASINGATESVRRLLAHGANPNTRNYWDWTPLHDAAIRGYAEIVELLLIAGAGTETRNSRDEGGNTALILASKEKECVRMLVHHGADVDATNEKGWTSLMEASHNGSVEVAEMLLMAGASIDVKDETERTAMDLAREGGHDDCARVLAEYGVN
jgi:ankyrin repeat protein